MLYMLRAMYNSIPHLFQIIIHIFTNEYLLFRSNFSYIFRSTEAIFRENSDIKKYIFYTKYNQVCS
jgi:hypothetical protein